MEVTTYRTESDYEDFRHPQQVHFVSSLHEDLARRDFTMNALAMDRHGVVYDYFQGKDDLHNRRIRTVGEPAHRFSEDALRMLRAIRFAAQLEFTIEVEALSAMETHAGLLQNVAVERIGAEFEKMMAADGIQSGLRYLIESHICERVAPFDEIQSVFKHVHTYHMQPLNIVDRWVFLLSWVEDSRRAAQFMRALRMKKTFIQEVKQRLSALEQYPHHECSTWTREQLYEVGLPVATSVLIVNQVKRSGTYQSQDVSRLKNMYAALPIQSAQDLAVTGQDIKNYLQRRPGPWIQRCLYELSKAVLHEKVQNKREPLLRWVQRMNENESDES